MDSSYTQIAWLIPLFPLAAFLILLALGRQMKAIGSNLSILAALASFVLAILVGIERLDPNAANYTWNAWEWLVLGEYSLTMGFEVTNLNTLMLVVVTLVSLLVQIYSKGYMQEDERINVFFSYVSLFTFAMLGLVIAENIVQLYIFWELMGLGSFLLIGFWYFKPESKAAAKKAFIITRIGDLGLFLAILLLFWQMPGQALDFTSIQNAFANGQIDSTIGTWIALLIFLAAVGKSGQFPLHTWLPDAMEGPTPISALIHAATMVAAGVYLVARTYPVFEASPLAMDTVAYIGAFTAIFAATIALAQNDLKRVLAYSTVSQLGYMMMALGIGAYTAGIFHLFTHAFFKALLFLCAGSIIHAIHKQNIHEMGGLWSKMRITAITFVIGGLALSGIFPLSGFWSKDSILAEAYHSNLLLFWVGLLVAFFTAFYMSRLFFLVFTGKARSKLTAHESPASMTVPLIILAALAIVAGFVFTPFNPWLGEWLGQAPADHHDNIVIVLTTIVGLSGIVLGWLVFGKGLISKDAVVARVPWLHRVLLNKYYIDELYDIIIVKPLKGLGNLLQLFDDYVVDGAVRLSSRSVLGIGRLSNKLQTGQMQTYGIVTILGLVVLVVLLVGRRFIDAG